MKYKDLTFTQKLLIIFAGTFIIVLAAINSNKSAKTKKKDVPSIEIGQIVPLQERVVAGRTVEDYREVDQAMRINDQQGWLQKIDNGTAYALQKGQRVKSLDYGIQMSKIRVEEGPNTGKACYVPTEYLTGDWK